MTVPQAGLVLLGLLAVASPARAAVVATQQEIEESLTCQCGCGLTVHSCNHLQCGSGEPMKKEIAERLARGEDKATILGAFRARYGEKVLSAPTGTGACTQRRMTSVTPSPPTSTAAKGVIQANQLKPRKVGDDRTFSP